MKITKTELEPDVFLFTVSNGIISFSAMNYGCTLTKILVPSKSGEKIDVLLGYDSLSGYKSDTESFGMIVGRVANRIKGASFSLGGKTFALDKNDGENSLHGGNLRWGKMLWESEIFEKDGESGVKFWRKSKNGEQGFPGNVGTEVKYSLNEKNEITLEYTAKTDQATPINLTNHAYFNLSGTGSILDHDLMLGCADFLELGDDCLPTGKILPARGSPFDFREFKKIGSEISKMSEKIGGGYDHCFVTGLDESKVKKIGEVFSEKSGIRMEISTNQTGVHLYTGNFLGGKIGKSGVLHKKFDGVCFETERFPNAVNEPNFPNCILNPGETYWHKTVLKLKGVSKI